MQKTQSTINSALHALNREFSTLFSDGLASFDETAFAQAWSAMGVNRDQQLITLARSCRYEFRKRIQDAEIQGRPLSPQDQFAVLRELVDAACGFAYRYLGKRQTVLFMDALTLAFEADVATEDFIDVISSSAVESDGQTPGRLEAVIMGVTGVQRYDIEKISKLDEMDVQKQSDQR